MAVHVVQEARVLPDTVEVRAVASRGVLVQQGRVRLFHATTVASFEPGTLQIFAGRYSLHHVKRIPEDAKTDRLVAVLCFAGERGVVNSPSVQQMFWGRTRAAGAPHDAVGK